jgi:hypothetical protein
MPWEKRRAAATWWKLASLPNVDAQKSAREGVIPMAVNMWITGIHSHFTGSEMDLGAGGARYALAMAARTFQSAFSKRSRAAS